MFFKAEVRDFGGNGQHDYTVYLGIEELKKAISAVAVAATEDPKGFEKRLEPVLKSLAQLQAIAAGTFGGSSA